MAVLLKIRMLEARVALHSKFHVDHCRSEVLVKERL